MKVTNAEADRLGAERVDAHPVDYEGLHIAAAVREEALAKGWTPAKAERASTTAFMLQRQRQADAWEAEHPELKGL